MSEREEFHVGDILSAMTGRLVSPSHMDGIYRILNHLTADSLMTHQLPRAMDECEPYLREQFPDLAEIEVPEGMKGEKAVSEWLAGVVAEHGQTREVEAMADGVHEYRNPIAEAEEMWPGRVVTVTPPQEPQP